MKRYSVIGLLLAAALLVASCATATPTPTAPPPTSPAESAVPQERVLVLWTHEYPTYNSGLRDKWIPEFEAAHPGVKVDYQVFPYSGAIVSFDTKLLAEVASGGGPDVWAMASHNFTQAKYIEAGLLAPLDPSTFGYDSLADAEADYPRNSLSAFINNGQLYALPSELTTLCLFYNQTMFDEAGIPYPASDKPASWQQIGEISQKLLKVDPTTGKPSQMGYQFGFFANYPAPEWYIQDFYPILRQYGQDDLYVQGKPAGDSEAMVAALQQFYDMTHTYHAYDPYFVTDWFADFSSNRVAMVTAGPWYASVIESLNPDVRFGVAPHPVVDPETPASYHNIVYSFGFVVNAHRDAAQQQLAQEFIAFVLGKKGESAQHLWWFENVGMLQPSAAFLASPGYKQLLAADPWMNCFVNTFDTFQVDYYQHSSDEAGTALVRAINRVVYDGTSPQDSARLLQNELVLLP